MQKLHELLANLDTNKNKANNMLNEARQLFTNKNFLLEGVKKTYKPLNEDDFRNYKPDDKIVHLATTVKDKINFTKKYVAKAIDEELTKNETNRSATAILKFGDKAIELSICTLMDLEKHVNGIRRVYETIPTLDSTIKWEVSKLEGQDIYESEVDEKFANIADYTVISLAKATKEHKEQVEKVKTMVPVGIWSTINYSGKMSSASKSQILDRIDKLLEAIRVARCKANDTEVIKAKIGEDILNYIHGDLI